MSIHRYSSSSSRVNFDGARGMAWNESVMATFRVIEEDDGVADEGPDLVGQILIDSVYKKAGGSRGRASDVLRAVTTWADENCLSLFLQPTGSSDPDQLDNEELRAWYGRHGFVWYTSGTMVRRP